MRKNYFFKKGLFLLLLALTAIIGYLSIEPLYTPTAFIAPHQKFLLPKYIAHKSIVSGHYLGGTEEAIKEALHSPVDGIELDVRLSKDKVPFIFHADSLEETTNGIGRPENKTWEELKKIRYCYQKDCSEKILSLEQVFQRVGSEKYLFLDIKEKGIKNNGFTDTLASLLTKYQLHDTVVVESFNPAFLTYLRLKARDIVIMYDFTMDGSAHGEESQNQFAQIPWILKQPFFQKQVRRIIRPDLLGIRWNVDHSIVKKLIKNGYPVYSWTVDDPTIAKNLFDIGISGLQSNQPLKLLTALQDKLPRNVQDAGGTVGEVAKKIIVTNEQDAISAVKLAKQKNLKISIAGRQHSMGGQSFANDSILLDMLGYNKIHYDPNSQRVTAQAGATWSKIQKLLDRYGRSLIVMQSDNIFSVGGTISVNAHGWQVGKPPIGATVASMKVLTTDGKIHIVSLSSEPELFKSIIGGYGQFAVILEIELNTVPNSALQLHSKFFPAAEFKTQFEKNVSKNPNVELAYGRLSVDKDNFLQETGLFWFEKLQSNSIPVIQPERFIAIKRAIFRAGEYSDIGKKIRWSAEKNLLQKIENAPISRNTEMGPDIHLLWPIRSGYRDILHEYFIPKGKMVSFIEVLKKRTLEFDMNLLNVTIREVRKDALSNLPYARTDSFAFVLFFSQKEDSSGEARMNQFTRSLIDDIISMGGTFYLPYRLHYSWPQLTQSYPMIQSWIQLKEKWDPTGLLSSQFYNNILLSRKKHTQSD